MSSTGAPGYEHYVKIVDFIRSKVSLVPRIMIICGSGLGGLADAVTDPTVIEYNEVPGFAVSTVAGHKGRLVFGMLGGKPVVCMQGRVHMYEGYPMWQTTMPVRICKMLGCTELFATNASGGLNQDFKVTDIMVMTDHINFPGLAGQNPLVGPNIEEFGPRFPPMSRAYDRELQKIAHEVAADLEFSSFVKKGVYAMVAGPSYETVTECKMLKLMGADVVGMSTAPEVVVGVHCGLKCLGMSLVTNLVVLDLDAEDEANHAEVIEAANARAMDMQQLTIEIIKRLK